MRRRGFIQQESLISSGLHILATPVLDPTGHAVGAVSVAAPIIRVAATEILEQTLPHVLAAAKDIGRALQTSGSTNAAP